MLIIRHSYSEFFLIIDFEADMLIISLVQLSVSCIVFEFDLPVDVFELISWCCSFLGKYHIHLSSFLALFWNLYAYFFEMLHPNTYVFAY